jgi:hypothetical protein
MASVTIDTTPGQVFFLDRQTLPTTGTYTLWIQHRNGNTGSATIQLSSVPADFTAPITAGGAALRVPSTGNTAPGQNASLTFNGTAGQKVSISVSNATYTPFTACYVSLKDPGGSTLSSGQCGAGSSGFIDTVTLAANGTYTLFVDPQGAATGSTTIALNDDTDITGPISIDGGAVTTGSTSPGQDVRLTFSATAGQNVFLQVSNVSNPSATAELLKPDGTLQAYVNIAASAGQIFFIDRQALATTGTYTIWIKHTIGYTGSETLQLTSVPADASGTITVGGAAVTLPAAGNNALGQNGALTFTGVAGQSVRMLIGNTTYTPNTGCILTVKDPSGSTVTSVYCGVGTPSTVGPFTTSAGTYTIVVDPQGMATGNITMNLVTP